MPLVLRLRALGQRLTSRPGLAVLFIPEIHESVLFSFDSHRAVGRHFKVMHDG